ncbi:T9SS type A sorting domain-containing protein [Flavobacterium sp.]|uniref:DUF7619 domain-containing protein n=1 Tax=Flavobacterium sp. TaxID=239 RepID=UPI0039E45CCB
MNKHYLLILAVFFFSTVGAQVINFPDPNFKTQLLNANASGYASAYDGNGNALTIDANNDGEIEVAEALQLVWFSMPNGNVTSVEGLSYFSNIKFLGFYNNQLTALDITGLDNLESLTCSQNQITTLDVTNAVHLKYLDCYDNQLTSLTVGGLTQLEQLFCQSNQLTALDISGLDALTQIDCSHNQIASLALSPLTHLQLLNCSNNQIPVLDLSGFTSLFNLDCSHNNLSTLDVSQSTGLGYLHCLNNQLTSLNVHGLTDLLQLWCEFNQLQSLDVSGLTTLNSLRCNDNQLSSIDLSGGLDLWELLCDNNQLASIDVNQLSGLTFFTCKNNLLTTLDVSIHAQMIVCSDNQLTSLFIKNGSDEGNGLLFSGNPNLEYVCVDDFQLDEVQNMITEYGYANCFANTYCTFVPGGTSYVIQGNAKLDSNANGCDASDINFRDLKFAVSSNGDSGVFVANTAGNYRLPVTAGSHTVTPQFENPDYFIATPSVLNVDFPAAGSTVNQDFCITANGGHNDLDIVILPTDIVQPGFTSTYKILFKNKGTSAQSGTVVLGFDEPTLDFIVANPSNNNQGTGSLTWDFTNLQPFERREIFVTLKLNGPMDTPSVGVGYILNLQATVVANVDETPNDNTFNLSFSVLNSYDPNDKTCLEGATIAPEKIGQYVHYKIRFENTGTANAQNIVVNDLIDLNKFDVESLVPLDGSHNYSTRISGNNVAFIFENINLPFDDAHNDGYVLFKIKTKPSLVLGDTFSNTASIYFDYNHPIVTEPAVTTIAALGKRDFAFSEQFSIYPNPAGNMLNIQSKNSTAIQSVAIYNLLGQLVLKVINAQQAKSIDVSALQSGNYFIKIATDRGNSNTRFVKK